MSINSLNGRVNSLVFISHADDYKKTTIFMSSNKATLHFLLINYCHL
jgi:hypothetical protein